MRSKSARPPSISRRWKNVSRNESGNSWMTSTIAVTVNVATSTKTCGTVMLETLTMKENQSNSNTTEYVAALISSHDHQRKGRSGAKAPSLLACSLLAHCDGSRPATPAGCCPCRGECSQQGCRCRSRRVLEVTAEGNGKGTFRHIATMSRNVPIACPNAYNTITIPTQYNTPHPALSLQSRSIAPALFRGRPAPVPPPRKSLFVACSLLVVSVTAPLRSLYIGCLSSCSLLARCLLVADDTSGGLGRECVCVGAVAPTHTHSRPNSALRCFSEGGLRAGLAVCVCLPVRWLRQTHTHVQTPPSDVFFRNVSTVRKLHRGLQPRHKRKTTKKS